MKLVGLLCLVLACAGAGVYAAGRLKREVTAFEQLISLTEQCAAVIRCQSPELPELLRQLGDMGQFHFPDVVRRGLSPGKPPVELWHNAVWSDSAVPKAARETICSLGEVLGTTDVSGQLSAIALHRERLERAAAESRERCLRQGKLYRSLGLLGGALVAVLLM